MTTTPTTPTSRSSRTLRLPGSRLRALAAATALAGLGLSLSLAAPAPAAAFCGFYVAGADAQLFNDATMVVMMRDGKRTVLSMQNDYQGPPEDFALVIPVPVVLGEDDVKTLPKEVFDRVDKLAAPRLVEYWEQDPCDPYVAMPEMARAAGGLPQAAPSMDREGGSFGVTVEAQFTVGEYEIVILSASDSTGLDGWLRENDYKIPAGAEPLLRPYVEGGMKFFVAKVDVTKVKFESQGDGPKRATLSPLRFHYDSDEFALPIRLGLINAPTGGEGKGEGGDPGGGAQDLIVHVLARNTRYQVANYPNVTIPTNLEVKDSVRDHFGQFYVSLFDHSLEQNPKAVVTEYAWSASTCDPCPEPALQLQELVTLGADVLPAYAGKLDGEQIPAELEWSVPSEFVLTRLHARYDASTLGEDLVFEEAPGIAGGREHLQQDGQLERGAVPDPRNQFQARYIIRHPWTGKIDCEDPKRGVWGGPPNDRDRDPQPTVARELATVARDASLGSFITPSAGKVLGVATIADTPPADGEPDGEAEAGDAGAGDNGDEAGAKADEGGASKAGQDGRTKADDEQEKAPAKGCRCRLDTSEPSGPAGLGFGLLALALFAGLRRRDPDQL